MKIPALCFDRRSMISGEFQEWSEAGCELLYSGEEGAVPFPLRGRVTVNVLQPKNRQSLAVDARLISIRREQGAWKLRLRWRLTAASMTFLMGF